MKTQLLSILAAVALLFSACEKEIIDPIDGGTGAILLECDALEADRALKNDPDKPIDYVVDCVMSLTGNITVEPGTVIQFNDEAGWAVVDNGSLKALGTGSAPIVFTAKSKAKGSWRGLYFETASVNNQLEHCQIEYAGGSAFNSNDDRASIIVWADARVKIDRCEISKSENAGISMEYGGANVQLSNTKITQGNSSPVVAIAEYVGVFDGSSDFSGNAKDYLLINAGDMDGGKRIQKTNVPYRFSAEQFPFGFNVNSGVLTIDPGVNIEMGSAASIYVNTGAALRAVGSSSEKITFTSVDKVPGAWGGIYFSFTTNVNNLIENSLIEYAGDGTDSGKGAISLWANPRVTVRNTEFRSLPTCAVYSYNGESNPNLTLENNTLSSVTGQELCWD